ncbi:MAG TPA: TIGR03435 family protein [Candidatus Nitrosotenuis sp.]|nr:TIGR03435 family protein [Candidatus Nitrosotenuis sp.]
MLARIFLALLLFAGAQPLRAQQQNLAAAGKPAPPLTVSKWLEPAEKPPRSWEDLRGKIVVLEFWATWCGPCVAAIPHWNELVEKFRGRPVEFISISDEEEAVVRKFLAARPIKGWLALDSNRSMKRTYGDGEGMAIPSTFVIGPDGIIVGITQPESLTAALLDQLLAGDAAAVRAKLAAARSPSIEEKIRGAQSTQPLFEVLIRPGGPVHSGTSRSQGKFAAQGATLRSVISTAYSIAPTRIVMDEVLGNTRYDVLATAPRAQEAMLNKFLREALEGTFNFRARRETRETDVYVLVAPHGPKPALRPWVSGDGTTRWSRGKATVVGMPLAGLISMLESVVQRPIVDETQLTGKFDFELTWDEKDAKSMVAAVREQLGLELREARRSVEMLIIESAPPAPRSSEGKAPPPKQ